MYQSGEWHKLTQFAEFRGECGQGGDKPKESVSEFHLQLNQQAAIVAFKWSNYSFEW
jgi:hypothetical protein